MTSTFRHDLGKILNGGGMLRLLNTFTNSDSIKEGGDSVKRNGSISPQMVEDVVKTLDALCAALNWTPRRGPALCVEACRFSYLVTGRMRWYQ